MSRNTTHNITGTSHAAGLQKFRHVWTMPFLLVSFAISIVSLYYTHSAGQDLRQPTGICRQHTPYNAEAKPCLEFPSSLQYCPSSARHRLSNLPRIKGFLALPVPSALLPSPAAKYHFDILAPCREVSKSIILKCQPARAGPFNAMKFTSAIETKGAF